jgi:hypothetical protein
MTPSSNQAEQITAPASSRTGYSEPSEMYESESGYGETCGLDNRVWMGIAAGAAIGIGIMLSRRHRTSRWDRARNIARRVEANRDDIADTGRDLLDRMRVIYEESRKVIEEAQDLWSRGRSLVKSA